MSVDISSNCLLSPAQARQADSLAVEKGISTFDLMEAAGLAVAEVVSDYVGTPLETGGEIVILCGPGNNGGDGFVAARHLDDWGYPVKVLLICALSDLVGDAARVAGLWPGPVAVATPKQLKGAAVIVDALFGTGLNRPIDGMAATLIEAANNQDAVRIAVDIPSGLNAETGNADGPCFMADATVTFGARKIGQLVVPGRFLCGGYDHIHVADIGLGAIIRQDLDVACHVNDPTLWGHGFPFAGPDAHKYHRGHLLVLGGREPTLGASRLASLAALRTGAGLVTLAAPTDTYAIQATALTDVMVRRIDSAFGFLGILGDARMQTVLIGPGAGVGEKTAELVQAVAKLGRGMVLDADALTSLVGHLDILTGAKNIDAVLTPHEGEFARLFPGLDFRADRLKAACAAARAAKAVVVLKGASTIVAAPDGRACIAANAPAWLSVAGTGDVLAGMIAGLMVQGMPAFEAASAGVWLHGEAAMEAGRGLVASDLIGLIPAVLP